MSHPAGRLLVFLLAISASSEIVGAAPQDQSLLEQFGELLGGALRTATGENELAEPVAIDFARGQQGPAPSEKDRTEHRERLAAYSAALQFWVSSTCELSEEQKEALKERADQIHELEVTQFAKFRDQQHANAVFPRTFPILFANKTGIAHQYSERLIDAVRKQSLAQLTEEQQTRFESAVKERADAQHEAFVNYLVALFDKELFLNSEQQTILRTQLSSKDKPSLHPLYSFQPQSYYLPYEALGTLVPRTGGNKFLTDVQKKRLTDLTNSNPNSQHIIFQSESSPDDWQKQIIEAARSQRDRFLCAAAVRVSFLESELALTSKQSEYLMTASKGAAIRALGDWKETTQQTIDQMEMQMAQMGGNFAFGVQNIMINDLEQNEIWAEALKSLASESTNELMQKRREAQSAATAGMLLALLDRELWLMPAQREPLRLLIQKSLPKNSDPAQNQEYVRDIVLLAFPLFKIREQDRNDILTEPQREAWKQLQSFFEWQKQGNYMQIPLRNQGGSFGFMLSD
jgi:hypothetical protein